jgi:palmitoyltransferase ZDHHC1/11
VVAIAVFLALGFAFYVFFVPFVGGDEVQYVVIGVYTPLVRSCICPTSSALVASLV